MFWNFMNVQCARPVKVRLLASVAGAAAVFATGLFALNNVRAQNDPADGLHGIEKIAYDAGGNPISGPVLIGDTISYVINTYSSGSFDPLVVEDTLSGNQTYLSGSLVAPGWSMSSTPPYTNNDEIYTQQSSPVDFTLDVPAGSGLNGVGSVGGDGTIPIPIDQRVYGIYHHQTFASTQKIYCWNLYTLQACDASWPRNLTDEVNNPLATPQIVHHVVLGKKIYYPAVRRDTVSNQVIPGAGCWDTNTESPCIFVPFPIMMPGYVNALNNTPPDARLSHRVSGIVAVPDTSNPSEGRLYMQADDGLYCRLSTNGGACPGWTAPAGLSPLDPVSGQIRDILMEDDSPTPRIFVSGNSGTDALIGCYLALTGAKCPGWSSETITVTGIVSYSLSPYLDSTGMVSGACLHPWPTTGGVSCWRLSDGSAITAIGAIPARMQLIAYRMPGTARVLYPAFNGALVRCVDFSSGVPSICAPAIFGADWGSGNTYRDYGYSIDPAAPDKCLLGLGDNGVLWRFTTQGKREPESCKPFIYENTFDISTQFCGSTPGEWGWTSVDLIGGPIASERSGVIELRDSGGTLLQTIDITSPISFSYLINGAAAGVSPLTVTYKPDPAIDRTIDFKIVLSHDNRNGQQICYQATIDSCGAIWNEATLTTDNGQVYGPAVVNLGDATGGECGTSTLKICKVAGPGVTVGTDFFFDVTDVATPVSVPAGPAPGGYCKVVGTGFVEGSTVTTDETGPAGYGVIDITVAPASQLVASDLALGTADILIGPGVTEVTYTNESRTGFLEVCKFGDVDGEFSFDIQPGNIQTIPIPSGACTPAFEVPAGEITITENPSGGSVMVLCGAYPASRGVSCSPANNTFVVNVPEGGISTQTLAGIMNQRAGMPQSQRRRKKQSGSIFDMSEDGRDRGHQNP